MTLWQFTFLSIVAGVASALLTARALDSYLNLVGTFSLSRLEERGAWRLLVRRLFVALVWISVFAFPVAFLVCLGDQRLWSDGAGCLRGPYAQLPNSFEAVIEVAVKRWAVGLTGFLAVTAACTFVVRLALSMELRRHRKVLLAAVLFLAATCCSFIWAWSRFN